MGVALLEQVKARCPIGLDLGQGGLRMVQLKKSPSGLDLSQVAAWERSPTEKDDPEKNMLIERISQFVRQVDFCGARVVTALSPSEIEHHPLDMPMSKDRMSIEQQAKAAHWEIQRLSTLKGDRLQSGVWALPHSKRAKATMMGIAAPRDRVMDHVDLCDQIGLECVKVDVSSCALAALAWHLRGQSANDVWGVLDLGYRTSRLMVCVDAVPVLVRTFNIGSFNWTESIAKGLRLNLSVAEKHKREYGLTCVGESADPTRPVVGAAPADAENADIDHPDGGPEQSQDDMSTLIRWILNDDLQRLSLESERSFEYVLQCYPKRAPSDLVLVGGGSLIDGLDDYLSESLGIKVMPISAAPTDDTERLNKGLGETYHLEVCALACALSLQGSGEHGQR